MKSCCISSSSKTFFGVKLRKHFDRLAEWITSEFKDNSFLFLLSPQSSVILSFMLKNLWSSINMNNGVITVLRNINNGVNAKVMHMA